RPQRPDPHGRQGRLISPRKDEAAGKPAASTKLRRRVVAVSPERESYRSSRHPVQLGLPHSGDLRKSAPEPLGYAVRELGTSESSGWFGDSWKIRGSTSWAGAGRPTRYPWPKRQPICRRRSAWAGCSIPSATVARPSESPSRRIASTNASSASSPTSLSTNGFGIFRDSIGNSARRLSEE